MDGMSLLFDNLMKAIELLLLGFLLIALTSVFLANREMAFIETQITLMAKEMVDQADKDGGFRSEVYSQTQNEYLQSKIKTWVKPSDIKITYMSPAMGTKRTYLGQPVTLELQIQARKLGLGWIKKDLKVRTSSVNRGNYGEGYAIGS